MMYNDPEWASIEEWDAYAWFGFAISEAQTVERQLLVIATALFMSQQPPGSSSNSWVGLYDTLGRLTLGRLLTHVKRYLPLPPDLVEALNQVVATRNALAHEFFWPRGQSEDTLLSPEAAQKRLQAAASLFQNVSNRLDHVVDSVLSQLHIDPGAANETAATALGKP